MLILTIYLLACGLTSGPTAVICFYKTLSGSLTPRARILLLTAPPILVALATMLFCGILTGTTTHLPQEIGEAETSAQIRGTQIVFAVTAAVIFLGGYFTTLGTCLKVFGNSEIEDAADEEDPDDEDE